MTTRVNFAGVIFSTSLAIWLLCFTPLSASNTGFSLTMAGEWTNSLLLVGHVSHSFHSGI